MPKGSASKISGRGDVQFAAEKNADGGYDVVGTKGGEEAVTDLVNWTAEAIYDVVASQDQSEWKRMIAAYMGQGYTESEAAGMAIADRAKQLGLDFAGGAISGGIMGGGGVAINAINNTAQKTTSINLKEKSSYPYSMATVIQDYLDNVNDDVLNYAKECRSNKNAEYKRIKISDVSSQQSADAKRLLGLDFTGYQNTVERSALNHIEKRTQQNR